MVYQSADESVSFYSENRDTLNKAFEKEAHEKVKIQPLWEIVYFHYQDENKTKTKKARLAPDEVISYMKQNVPTKRCGKAVN